MEIIYGLMFDADSWKGVPVPRQQAALKACLHIHELCMQILTYSAQKAPAMEAVKLYGEEAIAKCFLRLLTEDTYAFGPLPLYCIDLLTGFYAINMEVPRSFIRHGVHRRIVSRSWLMIRSSESYFQEYGPRKGISIISRRARAKQWVFGTFLTSAFFG